MSANRDNFEWIVRGNSNVMRIGRYVSTSETWATIVASAYFNTFINEFSVGDWILIRASDDAGFVNVTSVTTNVTVSAATLPINSVATDNIQADAVTNAKLADDSVSLEQLDSGITPSHITVFAGKHTTTGGDATEAITVPGALATDLVFCQLHTVGATPRTVLTGVASADTVTIVFSGDPSTDHVVAYQVLRAAA